MYYVLYVIKCIQNCGSADFCPFEANCTFVAALHVFEMQLKTLRHSNTFNYCIKDKFFLPQTTLQHLKRLFDCRTTPLSMFAIFRAERATEDTFFQKI